MTIIYDVAVIGAGPGGSITATFLTQSGAKVLLMDKAEFPRDKTCGDALSPNALRVLAELGLVEKVRKLSFQINGVRLVSPDGSELIAPIPQKAGYQDHLYITPRIHLDNLLLENAIKQGVDFKPKTRITNINFSKNVIKLTGKNKQQTFDFLTRTAVIATGASTPLLLKTGILSKAPQYALAARAYFDNINSLEGLMEIRFDGVPLPGYGWIFPISETAANIGAGFMRKSPKLPNTATEVLDNFLHHKPVARILAQSQIMGEVKSYPLRMDFATAKTFGDRLLVVGEAAGLVNPFTGEGIDYAMESGQIAAEVLINLLENGDLSAAGFKAYDQRLRKRFQSLFLWTMRMRGLYMNNWLLNPLIRAAKSEKKIETTLLEVLLSYQNPIKALAPGTIYHTLRNLKKPK